MPSDSSMSTHAGQSRKERVLELLRTNRVDEAKALCEEVCRSEKQPGAWYLLGIIHDQLGNTKDAERCFREACRLRPDYADAYAKLGVALRTLGQLDEAIPALREALKLKPDLIEARLNLGLALAADHRIDEAIDALQETTRLKPDFTQAYLYLGVALATLGRHVEAIAAFKRLLELDPNHSGAHTLLGDIYAESGQMGQAVDNFRQALQRQPHDPETLTNLGNALSELGHKDEAVVAYRQALQVEPGYFQAHHNLGLTYLDLKLAREAISSFEQAHALEPENADVMRNLGRAWRLKGDLNKAIENYQQAIRHKPDFAEAHFNLSIVHLLLGQFREGWDEYAWHWRRTGSSSRPCQTPTWDGSNLAGQTVFLCAEQGIGDELFFLRFAAQLRDRGAGSIVYQPSPKIASLLARVPIFDRIATPDERPVSGGCVLAVGDLPRLLGHTRADQIPPPLALPALPSPIDRMRARLASLGPGPYLGVTWRAGIKGQDLGLFKEIPMNRLAEILSTVPGTVIVLQREPRTGEINQFSTVLGRKAHDFSALNDNLEEMLALLTLLHDYAGASNTNMYLRAGIGKTARVLVPAPPEWRWMAGGKESSWFPGFTVYRQEYDGGWERAFTELESDLRRSLTE